MPCPLDNPKSSPREIEDLAARRPAFRSPDGIQCKIRVREHDAIYPYRHRSRRVSCEPTRIGKLAPAYVVIRRQLRDDWSTELTGVDPEIWSDYMRRAFGRACSRSR